jgi:hypothetical protein
MEPNGYIPHGKAEDIGYLIIVEALKRENYYLPKANRKCCDPLVKFSPLIGVSNRLLRARRWIGHRQCGFQVTVRKASAGDMCDCTIVRDSIEEGALRRLVAE